MPHWPLALYLLLVLAVVGFMLVVGRLLVRGADRSAAEPYESGIPPSGPGGGRQAVDFYLVALLFVIFDLEVAFLFAWAVAARELGVTGLAGIGVFAALLAAGLLYEWRQGVLDLVPRRAARDRRSGGPA